MCNFRQVETLNFSRCVFGKVKLAASVPEMLVVSLVLAAKYVRSNLDPPQNSIEPWCICAFLLHETRHLLGGIQFLSRRERVSCTFAILSTERLFSLPSSPASSPLFTKDHEQSSKSAIIFSSYSDELKAIAPNVRWRAR